MDILSIKVEIISGLEGLLCARSSALIQTLKNCPKYYKKKGGKMNVQLAENINGYNTNEKLDILREATFALLTEVKSLSSPKRIEYENAINFFEEIRRFEIYLIEIALDKTNGNQFQAAQMLNLKHTTLHSKIKRYRISPFGRQAKRNGKSIGRHN